MIHCSQILKDFDWNFGFRKNVCKRRHL